MEGRLENLKKLALSLSSSAPSRPIVLVWAELANFSLAQNASHGRFGVIKVS